MAEAKLITIVSNSSGRVAHYTVDGVGESKRFSVKTTDEEIKAALTADEADNGSDEQLAELREKAKALGIKSTHNMKEETLLAKIAEIEADNGSDDGK